MAHTVELEITLVFATPFNIGTGALAGTTAEKPMIKDAWRVPYVPGSALKGKLRHECERLVRTLTGDENAVCRGPQAQGMCPNVRVTGGSPCPVCRIFGRPGVPASFVFTDLGLLPELRPSLNDRTALQTQSRYGVSLSRLRRVAKEDLLYTTEIWVREPEALTFRGWIEGWLADTSDLWQVALLLAGLRSLIALGGGRSRGLGWLRPPVSTVVRLDGEETSVNVKEVLEAWLSRR